MWPLVLVLAGMELMLAHRMAWGVLASVAALVLVVAVVAVDLTAGSTAAPGVATRSVPTSLGGASQVTVNIRFGAGDLTVGPLDQPSQDQLALMTYAGPSDLAPEPRYVPVVGGVGRLEYQTTDSRSGPRFPPFMGGRDSDTLNLAINLAPGVPIDSLQVQSGAANAHLDLSGLKVTNTDISVGASSAWIRLPASAGLTTAHINSGAATITLEIPPGVAAQVRHAGGMSTLDIDQNRFPSIGEGVYRSADYGSTPNQVDLSIDTGFTTITVR